MKLYIGPTIIPVNFDKVEHVIHLADLHIRLFQRHDEYKKVFTTLYENIKSKDLKNTIVVIAGDILHSKLDLSPESIELVSNFFRAISSIHPTFVIDGNHDLNLSNPNRMRSLKPIIENIDSKDLHYVRETGIYQVADIQFAHYGITETSEQWPSPDNMTGKTKICLFHGPVYGAETDSAYIVTSQHVDKGLFNGFDIVMLGDIHKYQMLQKYNWVSQKPAIAYCSSLIQQNHGENIDGHGYILWDLSSCEHTFVPIYNEIGYTTIILDGDTFTIPENLPEKLRLRVLHEGIEQTKIKKTLAIIRSQYEIVDVSISRAKDIGLRYGIDAVGLDLGDLNDVNVQNTLISDWIKSNKPQVDDALINTILNINKNMNGLVTQVDQSRNIHWRPLEFMFSNLFSFGEDNYIDFTDLEGTHGIFAPNASGKSSSMESLIYTLFDKTPRAFRGDHIMNTRKSSFECQLRFEINDTIYGIRRIGKKSKTGTVRVEVEFWKETNNGDIINLNGDSRAETNATIRSIIGTYEDFILTTLSGQNGNALFIDKSHTERKNLLNQFMGLNVFEQLEKLAHETSKELSGVLKQFAREDFSDRLVSNQQIVEQLTDELSKIQGKIDDLTEQSEMAQIEIETKIGQKVKVPSVTGDKDSLRLLNDKYIKKEEVIQKNIGVLENDIEVVQEKINVILQKLEEFDDDDLMNKNADYESIQIMVNKLRIDHNHKTTLINSKVDNFKRLEAYTYNEDCEICVVNNASTIEEIEQLTTDLRELEMSHMKMSDQIDTFDTQLEELRPFVEQFNQAKKLENEWGEYKIQLDALKSSLADYNSGLGEVIDAKYATEAMLQTFLDNEVAITSNNELDVSISLLKYTLSNNKSEIEILTTTKMKHHANFKIAETNRSDIMKRIQEVSQVELEFEAYKHYLGAINRDGIPYDIISMVIPVIEGEINSILSQIVPFTVALDVDGKNFGGRIVYDQNRSWPLENSSGMERFISSLAIRVALLRASNLPKSNFLIIDEGMGSLDSEYLPTMQQLFDMLKAQFDFIIVISHLDSVRDMVDRVMEIKFEDGYSSINTNK